MKSKGLQQHQESEKTENLIPCHYAHHIFNNNNRPS